MVIPHFANLNSISVALGCDGLKSNAMVEMTLKPSARIFVGLLSLLACLPATAGTLEDVKARCFTAITPP